MSTKSYPVEDVSFSVAQYRAANPNGDGIVNDYAGNAFDLVLSADKGTISQTGAAKICLNGQILEVAPDVSQFDFPAVTADTTYQVSLLCDPSKDKDALGALSLVSGVKGQIVIPSGGTLVPIWEVPRRNGTALVPTSPKVDLRRWAGDSVVVQVPSPASWPALPRGSFMWDSTQQRGYVRDLVGGSLKWVLQGPEQSTYSKLVTNVATNQNGDFSITVPPGVLTGTLVLVTYQHVKYSDFPDAFGPIGFTWSREKSSLTKMTGRMFYNGSPYANANPTVGYTAVTSI